MNTFRAHTAIARASLVATALIVGAAAAGAQQPKPPMKTAKHDSATAHAAVPAKPAAVAQTHADSTKHHKKAAKKAAKKG